MAHAIKDRDQRLVGVMLVARNFEYLGHVQSMLNYSRKLAALGRLSAGVAHEVKNPLNAMTIHLELLKQKLSPAPARSLRSRAAAAVAGGPAATTTAPSRAEVAPSAALEHVKIIGAEIRRLDQVDAGLPEVHAARGSEAAADRRSRRSSPRWSRVVEPECGQAGVAMSRGRLRAICRASTATRRCCGRRS